LKNTDKSEAFRRYIAKNKDIFNFPLLGI
jgi:hypothetical protein